MIGETATLESLIYFLMPHPLLYFFLFMKFLIFPTKKRKNPIRTTRLEVKYANTIHAGDSRITEESC